MTDIPFELFTIFIFFPIVIGIIGIWQKQPFLFMIAGAFIAFLAIITDNIIMGQLPVSSHVVGSTTTYTFQDNPFPFTQWHKIIIGLLGAIVMFSGVILWRNVE